MNRGCDAGFLPLMAAPSASRGNEGVFNLHNGTNVVSDILLILIMNNFDQPTKPSAYAFHRLESSPTTVRPLPSRRADGGV